MELPTQIASFSNKPEPDNNQKENKKWTKIKKWTKKFKSTSSFNPTKDTQIDHETEPQTNQDENFASKPPKIPKILFNPNIPQSRSFPLEFPKFENQFCSS